MRDEGFVLADILQWGDRTIPLLDNLDTLRIRFIANELAVALSGEIVGIFPPARVALLDKLSLTAIERLLRSPAICQALRTRKLLQLADIVEAEMVLDQCPDENLDIWSALGDVWLGAIPPPAAAAALSYDPAGRLTGPRIYGGIPIDLSLKLIPEFPGASLRETENIDSTLTPTALDKLNEAMVILRAVSPEACFAVTQMTSNLVLRTARTSAVRIRGATSAAALGRTVLVNVDQPSISVEDIVEGILHEAIHTLTSCAELDQPLMNSDTIPVNWRFSPWTGAELHPHAFLHACLVWFGLLNFWIAAEQHNSIRHHAGQRVKSIHSGFTGLHLDDRHVAAQFHTPLAVALLDEIQQRARRCA